MIATSQDYVMPVRPDLVVAKPPLTRRMVVFSVDNAEILDIFA